MLQALCLMSLVFCSVIAPASAEDKKGAEVKLDGLKSTTPAEWVEEKPTSSMRFKQFKLPKVTGDKDDAEVQIFQGLGGSVKDNVKRWKDQFQPADGKDIEDVAKVSEIKVGNLEATLLDVSGAFKSPPFDPKHKGAKLEGYRMIALQFKGPENLYQIKLIGPAKTVESYKKGFDEWLKNFK